MTTIEVPRIDAKPVLDERGFVLLWDLYVAGKWVGSRRTEKQCEDWLSFLCDTPIEATNGSPW